MQTISPEFTRRRDKIIAARNSDQGIVTENTRLCFDAYPRSGNSYLTRALFQAVDMPQQQISHHTHNGDNMALAAWAGIPCVSIVRAPEDCMASYLVFLGAQDDPAKVAVVDRQYRRFYAALLANDIPVFGFAEAIADPAAFTRIVADIAGVSHLGLSSEEIDRAVRASYPKANTSKIGLPNSDRDGPRKDADKLIAGFDLSQARDLFQSLHKRRIVG